MRIELSNNIFQLMHLQCIYSSRTRRVYDTHSTQFQMNRSHNMQRDSDKQRRSSGQIKIRSDTRVRWIKDEFTRKSEEVEGWDGIRRMYRDAFERSAATDTQPWYIARRSDCESRKREKEKGMKSRASVECEAKKCTYSSQMSRKMIRMYELCLSFFTYEKYTFGAKALRKTTRSFVKAMIYEGHGEKGIQWTYF